MEAAGTPTERTRLAAAGARATVAAMLGSQPRRDVLLNAAFAGVLLLAVLIALAGLLAILMQAFVRGAPALGPDLFTNVPSTLRPENAGFRPAILGSLQLIAGVILFVVPVGVGAAIYLEEYADGTRWFNRLIELNIQNLAAVPSIVYGILGLAFLVRGPLSFGPVILAGGLTLGLLVLPVVIIAGREAIRAVPPSIREGSMALGATKWQTIWKQVLPAAVPGIATGVILALARAIGETAPLIVVGAATFLAFNPSGLNDFFTAMPIQIFDWISRPSNDVNDYRPLAAAGILLLMILLLAMNSVAIWLRNRYEQRW
jgi:phosphate transport system permease protein